MMWNVDMAAYLEYIVNDIPSQFDVYLVCYSSMRALLKGVFLSGRNQMSG